MQSLIAKAHRYIIKSYKPLCIVAFVLACLSLAVAATRWQNLSQGIQYMDLSKKSLSPWAHIHAFKIDLQKNTLDLKLAKEISQPHLTAEELGQREQALIAINGGFFDEHHRPLGLRIAAHTIKNPVKPISWWGVFYIQNQKAYITRYREFKPSSAVEFAVQSGPRLIVNGQIPSLKQGIAERSALCITKKGHVVILATEHAAMTTTELATLMKAPPLNCVNALNLDGGKSTQLFAAMNHLRLNVHGFSSVSDVIVVHPRN